MSYQSKAAKYYQAGYTMGEAIEKGANVGEFLALEKEFKGGSIPIHLLHNFKKTEPYSCDYHTGKGALRELIAQYNKGVNK